MDTDDMTTRPTIETVLERINSLGENLSEQILSVENQLNTRFDLLEQRLQSQIEMLQSQIDEIRSILQDFSWKIDALNKNFLQLQADQLGLRERVQDLESKAS